MLPYTCLVTKQFVAFFAWYLRILMRHLVLQQFACVEKLLPAHLALELLGSIIMGLAVVHHPLPRDERLGAAPRGTLEDELMLLCHVVVPCLACQEGRGAHLALEFPWFGWKGSTQAQRLHE
mgnify:CR=1 FL=1